MIKRYIKTLITVCGLLLLCITGCEKKELKKAPPLSEQYALYLSKTDKETIEKMQQYGDIVNLEEENYFLEMDIAGEEKEIDQKIKNIKQIERVERVLASHPRENFITVD